ncbi:MAG: isochorismatase family cysteine hydrolase [Anaerolineae bacterium]
MNINPPNSGHEQVASHTPSHLSDLSLSPDFTQYMLDWYHALKPRPLVEALPNASRAAIVSVDLTIGFAYEGALSSPRVAALVPRAANLFQRAWDLGVRNFIIPQDTHSPQTPEFAAFAPHCIRDTPESQMVPELASLPFKSSFVIQEKNSLSQTVGTEWEAWLAAHPDVTDFVVIGDCTDFCIYQSAMFLRLQANAFNLHDRRVIVPANVVDTYDLGVPLAQEIGAMPHPGDFFHLVFLYHMALNGIEVVAALT